MKRPSQMKALVFVTCVSALLLLHPVRIRAADSATTAAADTTTAPSSPWSEDGACASRDGTCSAAAGGLVDGYDALQLELPEEWHDERPTTCDDDDFWELEWRTLQVLNSHYQHVEFCQDPRNDDMCLDVDNIIQICASYRPHYHELMVHYTAKFLQQVRRVAFIGGGDSMLLHEVLKYPSLELVVGLELDQQVTRGSFKYFGSQPHWDDDRVEWWFGDATKSLMVLPKEYYGSFDLVLVDLSETVMALSVTDELDVMQALALLLQPNGILVQNEIMHFPNVSEAFQHTVHCHVYDVPIVCSQSIVMASNGVNFLRQDPTDHNVTYHLTELLDNPEDLMLTFHDYQRNPTKVQGNCRPSAVQSDALPAPGSAGVLMVVDAEQILPDVNASAVLQQLLDEVLEREGFTTVSRVAGDSTHQALVPPFPTHSVIAVLREGYVVVHCVPQLRYCALDVHLWARLERHKPLKAALMAALGGKEDSTFRIVAGGMQGVGAAAHSDDGSKEPPRQGPLSVETCGPLPDAVARADMEADAAHRILQGSAKLIESGGGGGAARVAVLCGLKGEPCDAVRVLNQTGKFKVLELHACDELTSGVEYAQDGGARLFACEAEITKTINQYVSQEHSRLDAIVVDPGAPFAMGQIVLHLFGSKMRQKRMLSDRRTVLAPLMPTWQRAFVDRFRTEVFKSEPLFRAEVLFNTTDRTYGMAFLSSGDAYFLNHFASVLRTMEQDMGVVADVQNVRGPWTYDLVTDFQATKTFTHLDYDQRGPWKQWNSQLQVFRHAVVQLVLVESADSAPITPEGVKAAVEGVLRTEAGDGEGTDAPSAVQWTVGSTAVGSGLVVGAVWSGGSVLVSWDGATHVDVNCLSFDDDESLVAEVVHVLNEEFQLETGLCDEYPRGVGRVVNWHKDADGVVPHWASAVAGGAQTEADAAVA